MFSQSKTLFSAYLIAKLSIILYLSFLIEGDLLLHFVLIPILLIETLSMLGYSLEVRKNKQ